MPGCQVLGVIAGTPEAPRVAYLDEPLPASPEVLALSGPFGPTRVLRLAATCEEAACTHFDGHDCRLATRVVDLLPAVVDLLPRCTIRPACRWYAQEGKAACLRCPQIVTEVRGANDDVRRLAAG
jgi:hypothetical protein